MSEVSVQEASFDSGAEISGLHAAATDVGAVVSFTGLVRDHNEGSPVFALELEHYPGMTERSITGIIAQARARWPLGAVRVIHRVGHLRPGDPIVFVGVAAAHRAAAFEAAAFVMDYLKTRAPFWKREHTDSGPRWVESRCADARAAARWE